MEKVSLNIKGKKKDIELQDAEAALIITLQELTHSIRMANG